MKKPKPFIVCFDAHRPDGKVWAVQQSRRWLCAASVHVQVPLTSVYLGPDVAQPKAYFQGVGVIHQEPGGVTIAAR